jgi:hypothetical protein
MIVRRLVVLALVLSGPTACAPRPPELAVSDVAAIREDAREFLDEFARLGRAGRLDSLSRLYSTDSTFRFYESGALRYLTADSVRAALLALPAGTTLHTSFSETTISALGTGLATVGTRFTTAFGDSLSTTFSFTGVMTLILRREPEGWRILSGHSSVPVPRRS